MVITTAIFLLLIGLTGLWLMRKGKPYPGLAFNLHKLIALGAAAYVGIAVVTGWQSDPPNSLHALWFAAAALLALAAVLSGGLLNLPRSPAWLLPLHRGSVALLVLLYVLFLIYMFTLP